MGQLRSYLGQHMSSLRHWANLCGTAPSPHSPEPEPILTEQAVPPQRIARRPGEEALGSKRLRGVAIRTRHLAWNTSPRAHLSVRDTAETRA